MARNRCYVTGNPSNPPPDPLPTRAEELGEWGFAEDASVLLAFGGRAGITRAHKAIADWIAAGLPEGCRSLGDRKDNYEKSARAMRLAASGSYLPDRREMPWRTWRWCAAECWERRSAGVGITMVIVRYRPLRPTIRRGSPLTRKAGAAVIFQTDLTTRDCTDDQRHLTTPCACWRGRERAGRGHPGRGE